MTNEPQRQESQLGSATTVKREAFSLILRNQLKHLSPAPSLTKPVVGRDQLGHHGASLGIEGVVAEPVVQRDPCVLDGLLDAAPPLTPRLNVRPPEVEREIALRDHNAPNARVVVGRDVQPVAVDGKPLIRCSSEREVCIVSFAGDGDARVSNGIERMPAIDEALVGVDGEWRGIQVTAMPTEKQVIHFDPTAQPHPVASDLDANSSGS